MTDDMGVLDDVYRKLKKNKDLMKLLGNPKTEGEINRRIRRELTPLSYATVDNVNFVSIYFSSATETDNIYVLRGFLCVDYYAKSRADLKAMKRIITEELREEDFFVGSCYNLPSDTKGVYKYAQRYRPLMFA